jgi:hypothetical protein
MYSHYSRKTVRDAGCEVSDRIGAFLWFNIRQVEALQKHSVYAINH